MSSQNNNKAYSKSSSNGSIVYINNNQDKLDLIKNLQSNLKDNNNTSLSNFNNIENSGIRNTSSNISPIKAQHKSSQGNNNKKKFNRGKTIIMNNTSKSNRYDHQKFESANLSSKLKLRRKSYINKKSSNNILEDSKHGSKHDSKHLKKHESHSLFDSRNERNIRKNTNSVSSNINTNYKSKIHSHANLYSDLANFNNNNASSSSHNINNNTETHQSKYIRNSHFRNYSSNFSNIANHLNNAMNNKDFNHISNNTNNTNNTNNLNHQDNNYLIDKENYRNKRRSLRIKQGRKISNAESDGVNSHKNKSSNKVRNTTNFKVYLIQI